MAMTDEPEDEMDPIDALLPWYAAGTLNAFGAKSVDEALAARSDLRASLALTREDREETIALNESLGAPSSAVLARVLAVAKAEPRKPSLLARLAAFASLAESARPARLAFAGAAAAVVILLQAATIVALLPTTPRGSGGIATPGFGTATGSKDGKGAFVLVQFAPDARLDQLGAFLAEHHAKIVEGPSPEGMYKLRVGDKSPSPDELSKLIVELGKSPLAAMVLPSQPD
jgi:hypothetical protein